MTRSERPQRAAGAAARSAGHAAAAARHTAGVTGTGAPVSGSGPGTKSAENQGQTMFLGLTVALAVLGTWLFFGPLWSGGGLVGGDVYSYSLPQKALLSESLAKGTIPLWNHWTGAGYPTLGESQTGVFYPLHLLAYGLLSVGTAWNVVLLTHYGFAFLAATWAARVFGLSRGAALWAAVIYVYGWFPPRAFLEWAILGGVYLPAILGATERYWETRRRSWLALLSVLIGLQLLGGHYQMAFLTWLTTAGWVLARATAANVPSEATGTHVAMRPGRAIEVRAVAALLLALILGMGLAAVQLGPSWELKGRSQRATVGGEHQPGYGHLPPVYLSQLLVPWFWYDPEVDLDRLLREWPLGQIAAGTNRVEAHLYLGQLPMLVLLAGAGFGLLRWVRERGASVVGRHSAVLPPPRSETGCAARRWWAWGLLGALAAVYATGWLMPALQAIPGFNFFRGPGRAGVITTWALALLTGAVWDDFWRTGWASRCANWQRNVCLAIALIVTVGDLLTLPTAVSYAVAVSRPPIAARETSPIRQAFREFGPTARVFAPGPNVLNLAGVSQWPVYLGLGPAEYFAPAAQWPTAEPADSTVATPERLQWLAEHGVTHVLTFEPLSTRAPIHPAHVTWPVTLVWTGFDPLFNAAWGRFQEPLYLYRFEAARGRCWWLPPGMAALDAPALPLPRPVIKELTGERVVIETHSPVAARLVLADLDYPGWFVTIDGNSAATERVGPFRAVEVPPGLRQVVWSYRPTSVYWGGGLSGLALLAVLVMGGTTVGAGLGRRRHNERTAA